MAGRPRTTLRAWTGSPWSQRAAAGFAPSSWDLRNPAEDRPADPFRSPRGERGVVPSRNSSARRSIRKPPEVGSAPPRWPAHARVTQELRDPPRVRRDVERLDEPALAILDDLPRAAERRGHDRPLGIPSPRVDHAEGVEADRGSDEDVRRGVGERQLFRTEPTGGHDAIRDSQGLGTRRELLVVDLPTAHHDQPQRRELRRQSGPASRAASRLPSARGAGHRSRGPEPR